MGLSGKDFPRPSQIKTYHTQTYARINPSKSGFNGKGKTIFITGGATGVGYSICRAFADTGVAKIVIVSRSPKPLEKAKQDLTEAHPGLEVHTKQLSVDDTDAVTQAMKEAGPIDVLVLNAFYSHQQAVPSTTIAASEVAKTFNTNVVANYHMMTTYIGSMPTPNSGDKTILVVSSAGSHLSIPMQVGYGASKAALSRMVGQLALEHAPEKDHVKLVSFHPGAIYTAPAQEHYGPDAFEWEDVSLPGDFAVWLASGESGFLHGRFVWAEWDVDELLALKGKMAEDPTFLTIGLVY